MTNDAHQLDAKNARISELEGSNSGLQSRLSETLANLERYIILCHIDVLICEGKGGMFTYRQEQEYQRKSHRKL